MAHTYLSLCLINSLTLKSLNRKFLHIFWDKQLTSLPLPKTGLFVAWFLYFGFKGVKNKSILTVRTILYLFIGQIPSKLNDLDC